MDLHEELGRLVDALSREGIEYALCGGLAVAVYGYARATKDIDLLVRPEDTERILAAIEPLGYMLDAGELPFDTGLPHARRVRRIGKAEGPEILSVDLVLLPPWLAGAWESRQDLEWEGRRITVVSREGLLEMKPSEEKGPTVDMSAEALDRRLREVSELRRLCLSLSRARPVGRPLGPPADRERR